jgi:hypothetical protein
VAYHNPAQGFTMGNEPACHQQTNRKENSQDSQPVPSRPPKCKQEANTQNNTGNLASHNIKAGKNQERADDG